MPSLNQPQAQFLALDKKFKAFVCGFGSGKTWGGSADLCKFAWEWPGVNMGFFAPTYPQIRDIFYPTIEEVAADWGLEVDIKQGNSEVHLFSGGQYRSTIICRSMDKPGNIVGFKIGKALIDELDVMPKAKAEHAWRKIIARLRQKEDGLQNGVSVTTTPEGYKFVFDQFVKQIRDKPQLKELYGLVQASTYQNAKNLPEDYIPSLLASYPPQLINAYIRGQFVNLVSGSVYPNFDRALNHSSATHNPGEPLHIGLDFNRLNMTAVVNVIRDDAPITVDELTSVRDTPAMAALIKDRYAGHSIIIYPDASGHNASSKNASESDFSILRSAGLTIKVDGSNPAVMDRVNSANAMILNASGERRWKINTERCPVTTEAFEQQVFDKNGAPDKGNNNDHAPDAQGYFLNQRFGIIKRTATVSQLRF